MNVKKAIKRIAALAAGTTMVTATIVGAMAYDLSDYPAPFVENGVYDGKIVVGATADTADVLGAIDIAASLQAAATTAIDVDGTTTVSVTGGVQIADSDDFNLGDELDDFKSNLYDADDFPELLADGTVEDDDGSDFDYEQKIRLSDAALEFGVNDDYGDDPVFHIDLASSSPEIYFDIEFDDALELSDDSDSDDDGLTDSETIDMFGKTYTFDPDHDDTDDVTLYGSDVTVVVSKDEPVTVEVGGDEYTIEVLGGNSDDSSATVRVTGAGTETEQLQSGDSRNIAGLDVYVDDVFVSNIGDESISVSIFVGSNKIVIPSSAIGTSASYEEIEIDGDDTTDIFAWVEGSDLTAIDAIRFRIDPTDFDNEAIDDEWEWLVMGNEFEDPLFGFKIAFEGMTPDIESRNVVEFTRSGDLYQIDFENNDGDEYTVDLYTSPDGSNLAYADDLVLAVTSAAEDKFFILEKTETKDGDSTTYVFELRDIDDSNDEFEIRDLAGSTKTYDDGDEIEDTGVYGYVYQNALHFRNSTNGSDATSGARLVTKGGLIVNLDAVNVTVDDQADINISEDTDDLDEAAVDYLTFSITPDSDDEVQLSSAGWTNSAYEANDDGADYRYGISEFGTYFKEEIDQNGDFLTIYYDEEETDFNVFLNGPDAVVVTSSTGGGSAYQLNEIEVGSAVLDTEAMSLVGNANLIVVGGPCVNTVAMELLGNPEVCTEGFAEGKAKIKFFESQNALLVAGYSAQDTRGASYVLADYDEYDLTGDEVEVVVTSLSDLDVNTVA